MNSTIFFWGTGISSGGNSSRLMSLRVPEVGRVTTLPNFFD